MGPFFNSAWGGLFGVALAWVLLAAGRNTTLQADALTAAACRQSEARQCDGTGRGLAVCFGNDFVAHLSFPDELEN